MTKNSFSGKFLAFFCWASAVLAQSDLQWSPLHVAKLRSVSSAEISPDGQHIAYTLVVPRRPFVEDNGPAWGELHVAQADGQSRPLIVGQVNVSNLSWRPGTRQISFLSKRGQDKFKSLYLLSLDGGEANKILEHDADIASYSWSPDGKQVAFIAQEKPPKNKKELEEKGFNQEVYEEDWRPNKLWVAEPQFNSGAWNKESFPPKPHSLPLTGSVSAVRWGPDGKFLAAAISNTPLVDDEMMGRNIHVVDVAAGQSVAQLKHAGKLDDFEWSPDGKHLAVIAANDLNDTQAGRLMIGSAEGGEMKNLQSAYAGHTTAIAWQDADTIMFLGDEGVYTTFNKIDLDGGNAKTIIPTGLFSTADFSLSDTGQEAAFIADSPTHPGEVFFMKHGEASPRRLTNSNPWLAEMKFAPQEVVTFKARDGLELEGLLIRPLQETPDQKYPLIVVAHGGPEAHYRQGWLTRYANPGQVWASRGYVVFYPNYRGSTGRGVDFAKIGQSDFAGKEFDDIVDGVDHLVAVGLVDPQKVGVTGGSYGGYATAWLATYYTERFAAGVMFVGISEQLAKFGTTDIPNEMYLVHERNWPWEKWGYFLERSPVYHAPKAKTPLLIMHGKDDPRVHPSQSMMMYRYLKTLNQTPVRLVWYPGEGHGNRKAAGQLDFQLRLLQWMDHYLKGPGGHPPPYELDYSAFVPKEPPAEEKDNQ